MLKQLVEKLNPVQMQETACTLWTIWNGRNTEVHGDPRINAQVAANFVKHYLEEFNNAQLKNAKNLCHWKPSQHWRPPNDGEYKLNFDGSIDLVAKKGGIRIIIRNAERLVMCPIASAQFYQVV